MKKSLLIASLAALALAGCKTKVSEEKTNSTAANISAPAGQKWNETVAATDAPGFLMGNPNAPVKLVEYGALSCPVCRQFSLDSAEKLKTYVAKGTVSMEFRPFFVHPQDLPGTMLATCNGPGPFFMIAERMFADQKSWAYNKNLDQGQLEQWNKGGPIAASNEIANYLDMQGFVAKLGVSSDRAKACLNDKAALDKFAALQDRGAKEGVRGTPTFFINGVNANVITWEELEPLLVKAGG